MGAGLLAKAECQATSILDVPAPSRASPLPQGSHFKFELAGVGLTITYSPASSHNHDNYSQRLGATLPVPDNRKPCLH
ncbi:hypothetical protein EMIT0P218_200023 [Pseudomonas sp. IT-P218]